MLSTLNKLSFDNEAKTRRQLISVSVVLLIFKNLELASNQLTLLGLEIIISKPSIVSATTVVLIITIIAFVFAFAEKFPKRYAHYKRRSDDKWWKPIEKEIDDYHNNQDPDREYSHQHDIDPDWDDMAYSEKSKRSQKRRKILNWYRPITTITRLVSNFLWPILIAAVSLFYPEIALEFISK